MEARTASISASGAAGTAPTRAPRRRRPKPPTVATCRVSRRGAIESAFPATAWIAAMRSAIEGCVAGSSHVARSGDRPSIIMASAKGSTPSMRERPRTFSRAEINADGCCVMRTASASAMNSRDAPISQRLCRVTACASLRHAKIMKIARPSGGKTIPVTTYFHFSPEVGLFLGVSAASPSSNVATIALAQAMRRMSPCITWANSCATTAASSSSSSRSTSARVTTMRASWVEKPQAKAFSASLSIMPTLGARMPAAMATCSTMLTSRGASRRDTS